MQLKFRDWLIISFFGITLIVILFFPQFSYQRLKESTLEKTKDQLHVSVRTVETHRSKIMKKLGVANTAEMIRAVYEKKII